MKRQAPSNPYSSETESALSAVSNAAKRLKPSVAGKMPGANGDAKRAKANHIHEYLMNLFDLTRLRTAAMGDTFKEHLEKFTPHASQFPTEEARKQFADTFVAHLHKNWHDKMARDALQLIGDTYLRRVFNDGSHSFCLAIARIADVYVPSTCSFVAHWLNLALPICSIARRAHVLGELLERLQLGPVAPNAAQLRAASLLVAIANRLVSLRTDVASPIQYTTMFTFVQSRAACTGISSGARWYAAPLLERLHARTDVFRSLVTLDGLSRQCVGASLSTVLDAEHARTHTAADQVLPAVSVGSVEYDAYVGKFVHALHTGVPSTLLAEMSTHEPRVLNEPVAFSHMHAKRLGASQIVTTACARYAVLLSEHVRVDFGRKELDEQAIATVFAAGFAHWLFFADTLLELVSARLVEFCALVTAVYDEVERRSLQYALVDDNMLARDRFDTNALAWLLSQVLPIESVKEQCAAELAKRATSSGNALFYDRLFSLANVSSPTRCAYRDAAIGNIFSRLMGTRNAGAHAALYRYRAALLETLDTPFKHSVYTSWWSDIDQLELMDLHAMSPGDVLRVAIVSSFYTAPVAVKLRELLKVDRAEPLPIEFLMSLGARCRQRLAEFLDLDLFPNEANAARPTFAAVETFARLFYIDPLESAQHRLRRHLRRPRDRLPIWVAQLCVELIHYRLLRFYVERGEARMLLADCLDCLSSSQAHPASEAGLALHNALIDLITALMLRIDEGLLRVEAPESVVGQHAIGDGAGVVGAGVAGRAGSAGAANVAASPASGVGGGASVVQSMKWFAGLNVDERLCRTMVLTVARSLAIRCVSEMSHYKTLRATAEVFLQKVHRLPPEGVRKSMPKTLHAALERRVAEIAAAVPRSISLADAKKLGDQFSKEHLKMHNELAQHFLRADKHADLDKLMPAFVLRFGAEYDLEVVRFITQGLPLRTDAQRAYELVDFILDEHPDLDASMSITDELDPVMVRRVGMMVSRIVWQSRLVHFPTLLSALMDRCECKQALALLKFLLLDDELGFPPRAKHFLSVVGDARHWRAEGCVERAARLDRQYSDGTLRTGYCGNVCEAALPALELLLERLLLLGHSQLLCDVAQRYALLFGFSTSPVRLVLDLVATHHEVLQKRPLAVRIALFRLVNIDVRAEMSDAFAAYLDAPTERFTMSEEYARALVLRVAKHSDTISEPSPQSADGVALIDTRFGELPTPQRRSLAIAALELAILPCSASALVERLLGVALNVPSEWSERADIVANAVVLLFASTPPSTVASRFYEAMRRLLMRMDATLGDSLLRVHTLHVRHADNARLAVSTQLGTIIYILQRFFHYTTVTNLFYCKNVIGKLVRTDNGSHVTSIAHIYALMLVVAPSAHRWATYRADVSDLITDTVQCLIRTPFRLTDAEEAHERTLNATAATVSSDEQDERARRRLMDVEEGVSRCSDKALFDAIVDLLYYFVRRSDLRHEHLDRMTEALNAQMATQNNVDTYASAAIRTWLTEARRIASAQAAAREAASSLRTRAKQ